MPENAPHGDQQFDEAESIEVPAELNEPIRRRLSDTRRSLTHHFTIHSSANNEIDGYITVGLFDDGQPGEVFIKMAKQGSTISGLMETIGILVSMTLQYGVPIEVLANKFSHTRFEPAGWTNNEEIRQAKSLVDYIFRWLGMEFSESYRKEQQPRN